MLIKIKRQDNAEAKPYWQTFEYYGDMNVTVAAALEYLNYNDSLVDTDGKPARRIKWEYGCLQKMCGGCAMLINHHPALACETFLSPVKNKMLVLEPLTKFPVICDLTVDRSIIQENLKRAAVFLHGSAQARSKEYEHSYLAAKCLKCGLCLEACPNYVKGEFFYGAEFANSAYLCSAVSSERKEIIGEYRKHFSSGCSKSFACQNVCPMKIPTLSSMAKMNTLKK